MAGHANCATPAGVLRVRIANTFVERGIGLLFTAPLGAEEGLLITPCASIHTIGMRYAIDVVFLDAQARVLRVCPQVAAGRARFARPARGVLEIRAGTAARHRLEPGVHLLALAPAMN